MPFRSALSGINAAASELRVIGNNVANASTTGFKQSRANFADVYAASSSGGTSTSIGAGVRLTSVDQQFTQGTVGFTDNKLDMAINGEGFFILDDNGSRVYSRSGQFQADREGFIVNSNSQKMVVNIADEFGAITGAAGPLRLDSSNIPPKSTNLIEVAVNLDSGQVPPKTIPFEPERPSSFTHSTSLTVYDSLGTPSLASMYYIKTDVPNEWEVHTFVNGKSLNGPKNPETGEFTGNKIKFDGAGGLAQINGIDIPPGKLSYAPIELGTGADPMSLTFDLYGDIPVTQFGGNFTVNGIQQNGYTSGRLTGIDIDGTGIVRAKFTNGQTRTLGQVTLANFSNKNGLRQLGETNWSESFTSGPALIGTPGSGSLGLIQSGALENSNVDLTGQLVNMITAQRNFQANAQVISTADSVTQSIINIR
ncbi:MAG: flagellar hook protein FlgE [Woeseiaceae bacterium]